MIAFLIQTLRIATPYLFAAAGGIISERAGIIALTLEGFMATQLSAVTMIGTTAQGATDGLRFIQFYFGLPLAMVIIGVTLVPFLHGAKVYTAYEYLERRFDAKTRSLTAFLFLISRGMSCGTILAAPAVVFASVFGWPIGLSVAIMGVPTVLYTVLGGVQAVTWADVKQMVLVVTAIAAVIIVALVKLPVSPDAALRIAGSVGRLRALDFHFDLTQQYTIWSGVIGGTFLMTTPESCAHLARSAAMNWSMIGCATFTKSPNCASQRTSESSAAVL